MYFLEVATIILGAAILHPANAAISTPSDQTCVGSDCTHAFCSKMRELYGECKWSHMFANESGLEKYFQAATPLSAITDFCNLCKTLGFQNDQCVSTLDTLHSCGYSVQGIVNVCSREEMKPLCANGSLTNIPFDQIEQLLLVENLEWHTCLNSSPPMNQYNSIYRGFYRLAELRQKAMSRTDTERPEFKNYCTCQQVNNLITFYGALCKPFEENSHLYLNGWRRDSGPRDPRDIRNRNPYFKVEYLDPVVSLLCTTDKFPKLRKLDDGELRKYADAVENPSKSICNILHLEPVVTKIETEIPGEV